MAFCVKCGTQIDDSAQICPNCGAPQNQQQNTNQNAYVNPNVQVEGNDYTAQFDPQDIQNNKGMSVLAYIGILFLVPLLAAPQSRYARFHTNQGLVLFIADIIAGLVAGILSAILGLIPVIGSIIGGIISACISVIILILMIIGIVNAATGKAKELPIIGKIRILK